MQGRDRNARASRLGCLHTWGTLIVEAYRAQQGRGEQGGLRVTKELYMGRRMGEQARASR